MPKVSASKAIPQATINLNPSAAETENLLHTLKARFQKHKSRHPNLDWNTVQAKLTAQPKKIASLFAMETTGGEPDVISLDAKSNEYVFYDCSPESPSGRRSICYDLDGELERQQKGLFPGGNAVDLAAAMDVELLTETQYRHLQQIEAFDTKTSSWIHTPSQIRQLGGALFCDRRYNTVFVYHNGAQSFYAARGFRACLKI